jgi:protein-S-isoprenylcysteine O-methyltransferase Ste14
MNYFFEVITLVILFALYGLIHSILASEKVKIIFRKFFGKFIAFYRLGYNVFAVIGLYFIWDLAPQPSLQIYQLKPPFDYLVLIPQLLSLAGMIWCFKYISFKEFVGLNQFNRYLKNEIADNDLDENYTLRIEGPYKFSRHPVYFFSIIFLMFRVEMNLSYLTMFISFTAYFYIGSYFEEKKLVRLFGDVYKDYQKKVPRIFPYKTNSSFR